MSAKFTRKERVVTLLMGVFTLFFLGFLILFPKLFPQDDVNLYKLTELAGSRLLAGAIFLCLCVFMGYPVLSPRRLPSGKALLVSLPALLIAVNNFPILGLITGTVWVDCKPLSALMLVVACFGIGFFEELAFRGVVFPALLDRLLKRERARKRKKENTRIPPETKAFFLAILFTSAVFGLVHLLNVFVGGNPASVVLQIGYSFLIGGMCSIVLLKTRCVWFPVLIHTVYDVGGSLIEYLGGGSLWDTPTVLLTAVLGVFAFLWFATLLIRVKPEEVTAILYEEADLSADVFPKKSS